MSTFDCDVVIVGLGPTGSVLAHLLGKRGLSVQVIEREPEFYGNARAVYTDDECMRILQSAGVAGEIHRDMQIDTPIQASRADGRVIMRYWNLDRSNGWPVSNFLYQPALESSLQELLEKHESVQVHRGRELHRFSQDTQGVTVVHQATRTRPIEEANDARVDDPGDDMRVLRARYVVAADGGRSAVREQLGIRMDGKRFPQPWLVVDLEQKPGRDALHRYPYFDFICDPHCPTVNCPQPGPFHRFEFMMMPGQSKEYLESPETVNSLLSRHVDPSAFHVRRKLVYTFNALIAQQWRVDRVMLAGDAAHMTPQFMGQGMSSGIRDAANLAWKLEAVVRGQAGEELLDSYQSERLPHARSMIVVSVLLKDAVSLRNPGLVYLRDALLSVGSRLPFLRSWLRNGGFKPRPRYPRGRYFGLPRGFRGVAGTLMPQPDVRTFQGQEHRLDDLLGSGFSLIGLGVDPRSALSTSSRSFLESLNARYVLLYRFGDRPQHHHATPDASQGVTELEDLNGTLVNWFRRAGHRRDAVVVLRPDRFVFGLVQASRLDDAIASLRTALHSKTTTDQLDCPSVFAQSSSGSSHDTVS